MADLRISDSSGDGGMRFRTVLMCAAAVLAIALLATRKPEVTVTVPPSPPTPITVNPPQVILQQPEATAAPVTVPEVVATPVPVVDPPVVSEAAPVVAVVECSSDERRVRTDGGVTLYELADSLNNYVRVLREKNAALASIGTWDRVPPGEYCAGPDVGDRAHQTTVVPATQPERTQAPVTAPAATTAPVTTVVVPRTTQATSAPTMPPTTSGGASRTQVSAVPATGPKMEPVPGTNPAPPTTTTTVARRPRV